MTLLKYRQVSNPGIWEKNQQNKQTLKRLGGNKNNVRRREKNLRIHETRAETGYYIKGAQRDQNIKI